MQVANSDISVAVPCVYYSDILSITLPRMLKHFPNITVLTSPDDGQTINLANDCGAAILVTDRWYKKGATFSKSSALNEWLFQVDHKGLEWRLTLDADIFLPQELPPLSHDRDLKGLYSVRRRMCTALEDWEMMREGTKKWKDFPIAIPVVKNGQVWGKRRTKNPAAICGYFQFWHYLKAMGKRYFPYSPNAACYDVDFALSFPEELRSFIEGVEVLHLGPQKVNWDGRCAPRWDVSFL